MERKSSVRVERDGFKEIKTGGEMKSLLK